jgi:hypothetical protein
MESAARKNMESNTEKKARNRNRGGKRPQAAGGFEGGQGGVVLLALVTLSC